MPKNSLKTLRNSLLNKLNNNKKYVDARSFKPLQRLILSSQTPKLREIEFVLDNISTATQKLTKSKLKIIKTEIEAQRIEPTKTYYMSESKYFSANKSKFITSDNIEYYQLWNHAYLIKKAIKENPNSYIVHTARYYDENNNLITEAPFDPVRLSYIGKLTKTQQNRLDFIFASGSEQRPYFNEFIEENPNGKIQSIVYAFTRIGNADTMRRLTQEYKDNKTETCIYDGVVEFFKFKSETALTLSTKSKAETYLKKLIGNKETYAKAYNKENLEEIAKFCDSSITMTNLINQNDDIISNKNAMNRYNITFINTRINHADLALCINKEECEINDYEKIKKKQPFYIERMGKLITTNQIYKRKDSEFKILFKNWKEETNFDNLSIPINSLAHEFLTKYDYGLHRFFNSTYQPINNLYKELDLRKAYYNYSNKELNPHYIGIPSGSFIAVDLSIEFTYETFEELTNNNLIGFYEIKIKTYNETLYKLGFKPKTNHILFTPMIRLLKQYIDFKFIKCIYSPSVHIPFSEKFLEQENKLSHYSKAYGHFFLENETFETIVKPKHMTDYEHIIANATNEIYKEGDSYLIIEKVKNPKSWIHIAYAIHSYTQTQIIEQIMNMNYDDILGVKLDSIVIKKDAIIKYNDLRFKLKEAKIEKMLKNIKLDDNDLDYGLDFDDDHIIKNKEYIPVEKEDDKYSNISLYSDYKQPCDYTPIFNNIFTQDNQFIKSRIVFIGGKGGSGKTSSILNSKNLIKESICFTTFCWNLITEQKSKHPEIIGLSIPKITGELTIKKDNELKEKTAEKAKTNNIKYIVIDESTLINDTQIIKIIEKFPSVFIFILGDIDYDGKYYQCSVQNKVINPSHFQEIQYIRYNKSYRFDDYLNEKLEKLRETMKETNDRFKIYNQFKYLFNFRFFNKEEVIYNDEDMGITALNNNGLTDYYIKQGVKPKYYVRDTNLNKGLMRGQRLNEKPTDNNNYEETLFKTIHSFQGCELNQNNKIIIYLNSKFDVNLFYTAVSRARRYNQIYIIEDYDKETQKELYNKKEEQKPKIECPYTKKKREQQQQKAIINEPIKAKQIICPKMQNK